MAKHDSIQTSLTVLADLLRLERENQGISMNRLAEKSGLSQSTISLIENKKRIPGMDVYLRITTALNLNPADLIEKAVSHGKGEDI